MYELDLRHLRERMGISQAEAALRANMSQAQLSRIERGKVQPTSRVITRLAEAFCVHPGDLFRRRPETA